MIRVRSNCGRVVIEIVKETGQILSETMPAPRAREFAYDITKVCNKIENWNWAPGGGSIHEQVIHVDNAWYPIEEPSKDSREVLITTEGPEGRNIAVGFYVPERKNSQGETLPARWLVPCLGVEADGVRAQERLIAWSPCPRPAVMKKAIKFPDIRMGGDYGVGVSA